MKVRLRVLIPISHLFSKPLYGGCQNNVPFLVRPEWKKEGDDPFSEATAGRARGIGANEKGVSPSQSITSQ
jgi:hypothetical protein